MHVSSIIVINRLTTAWNQFYLNSYSRCYSTEKKKNSSFQSEVADSRMMFLGYFVLQDITRGMYQEHSMYVSITAGPYSRKAEICSAPYKHTSKVTTCTNLAVNR